jgi:hypothetical protein
MPRASPGVNPQHQENDVDITTARLTIRGTAALTQSRYHEVAKHKGELPQDYDRRTYLDRLHVLDGRVIIPRAGMHQAIVAAAKYSKRQIPGQGKATWTAKFQSGITVQGPLFLTRSGKPITPEDTSFIDVYANADGVRGSGKRVMRRFPQIPVGWECTFDVIVLDPIILEDVLREFMDITGMFVGIGQYRPGNGGDNGRFELTNLDWMAVIDEVRKR